MRGGQGSTHATAHDKHRLAGMGASKGWLDWAAQSKAGWLGLRKTANKQHTTSNNNGIRGNRQTTRNNPHKLETWTSVPE